jgi:sec-independent protein translocase protein TatA
MGGLRPGHWIVIAIVVLILFGAGKLQGFTRSLMQSARIIKTEAKALKDEEASSAATPAPQLPASQPQPPVTPPTGQPQYAQPPQPQGQLANWEQQSAPPPPSAAAPIIAPVAPVAPVAPPDAPGAAPRADG